jgi:ribosomal protein S12 methylthiotransferase accessory factor
MTFFDLFTTPDGTRKTFRAGTHRVATPAETVGRLRPKLAEFGITRVANVTGLDRIGVPVVMVCRPNARSLSVSQGKGATLDAARASGLMEAIELFHAEHYTLVLKRGSYEELKRTHRLVDVTALNFHASSVFHPNLPILWTPAEDLMGGEPVWVPLELVDADFMLPLPPGYGSFVHSTHGLASGNHRLEAISHGLCEVVERDVEALALLEKPDAADQGSVDLATVDDLLCREVLDRFARADMRVRVWETTSDIGIPCFRCALWDAEEEAEDSLAAGGYGCHPDRGVALSRALHEAAQSRLTLIAGSRDDMRRDNYEPMDPAKRPPWRSPSSDALPRRSFHQAPSFAADTIADDLRWQLDRLRTAGFAQVLVVDLTRPEWQLPVVRVIVPGLEVPGERRQCLPGRRALQTLMRRR